MKLEQFKAELHKRFPQNKDASEKQLKKDRRIYTMAQFNFLACTILFALFMLAGPTNPTVLQRVSFTALIVGGMGACLAMLSYYHSLVVEVNFELRLREALADKAKVSA